MRYVVAVLLAPITIPLYVLCAVIVLARMLLTGDDDPRPPY